MFRISEVRVTPILISDPPLLNVQGVHQPYTPRTVVEVVTESGASGLGETYGDADYLAVAEAFGPRLTGAGLATSDLHSRVLECAERVRVMDLDNTVFAEGLRGSRTLDKVCRSVTSAFEVAMLDALGHETGLPVHALLGGKVRDGVEYSAYLFYRYGQHPGSGEPTDDWGAALDPAGVVAQARRMAGEHGFRSFKLKGGVFEPQQEIAAIEALAEEFPGHPLRLDPNGAWSVTTSLEVAAKLEGIAEYLEDPCAGTENMAAVARGTSLPLATNMCVTAFDEIPEAFAADAVQVVLSDHHFWGGLRATQELAAICRTYGVDISMHSNTHLGISLAAMTQVAATIPGLHHACDTHRPWQTEDVITEPQTFHEGTVAVTDSPGLGVELDRESLGRLHERWLRSPVRTRDDSAAMRRYAPDWITPALPRW